MTDDDVFPPKPEVIKFTKASIGHLFPVLKQHSFGLVFGEEWAIATHTNGNIDLDVFPAREYSIPSSKALPQKSPDVLYVQSPKSVDVLDLKRKCLRGRFCDNSRTIANGIDKTEIVDYENGIALSVFNYDGDDGDIHRSFVIDDILNKKRLKEVPLPVFIPPLSVYFTPSCVFYQYSTRDHESPWIALDNRLQPATHPLVDLLNANAKDSLFYVINDNMLVSEEVKHAFIIGYNHLTKKDMLFLATWYGNPTVTPIPIDPAATAAGRRLVKSPNCNTISPSGKWVYFATDGAGRLPDTHYIIYLDPALPNGCLPPFKLDLEGDISVASWMTTPEGLVLYKDGSLVYYDLSTFKPENFVKAH